MVVAKDLSIVARALKNHSSSSFYSTASHCLAPPKFIKNRKIKIGFISKNFNNHTIGNVMCRIIVNGYHKKFESDVFFLSHPVDELADFIMQNVNHFERLPLSLGKAHQQIADKQLDILCYPDIGMDSLTYLLAFSRLAPV